MAEEPAKKTRSKKPAAKKRPSSTGKVVNVNADQTNWRTRVRQSRLKFDDDQKEVYLTALAEHGRKGDSEKAAGVSQTTVLRHIEDDPEFAAAQADALKAYRDKFVAHATNLALNGTGKQVFFDKQGNEVGSKTDYPVRLIELELKRVDPDYRDKQSIDLSGNVGGVLVAPAGVEPDAWVDETEAEEKDKPKP